MQRACRALRADKPSDADASEARRCLRGQALRASLNAKGCEVVQKLIRHAHTRDQADLLEELGGSVGQNFVSLLLESPHGNHVLQTMIEVMAPSSLDKVIQGIRQWGPVSSLARHPYGCRVLCRVLEHFRFDVIADMVDSLRQTAQTLVQDKYARFVLMAVMEHGGADEKTMVISVVLEELERAEAAGGCAHENVYWGARQGLVYAEPALQHRLVEVLVRSREWLIRVQRGAALALAWDVLTVASTNGVSALIAEEMASFHDEVMLVWRRGRQKRRGNAR